MIETIPASHAEFAGAGRTGGFDARKRGRIEETQGVRGHERQPHRREDGYHDAERRHQQGPPALRTKGKQTALAGLVALSLSSPALARDGPQLGAEIVPLPNPRPKQLTYDAPAICDLIAEAADEHGLSADFFARLIWKESRFDVKALSPVGAQGVAQFMPGTARLRGLRDPWDPRQAIRASAHFLVDLRAQFGNFGLAAAAYNGGPDRVANWLTRRGGLANETVDYVVSITHRPVEWFREPGREVEAARSRRASSSASPAPSCPLSPPAQWVSPPTANPGACRSRPASTVARRRKHSTAPALSSRRLLVGARQS